MRPPRNAHAVVSPLCPSVTHDDSSMAAGFAVPLPMMSLAT
jgi:hypothetical protein